MIDELRLQYPVSVLCRVLQVSSSGYYQRRKAPVSAWQREEYRLELEIRAAHRRTRETYGPERLREDLAVHGIEVGVHRIKRIRRKLGLKCKQVRKYKATTNSSHKLPVASNLLNQNFQELPHSGPMTPHIVLFSRLRVQGFSLPVLPLRKCLPWKTMAISVPLECGNARREHFF